MSKPYFGEPDKLDVTGKVMYAHTDGCGCCSDSTSTESVAEAIEWAQDYMDGLQEEFKYWNDWIARHMGAREISK